MTRTDPWTDRIAQSQEPAERRALLAEVAGWRARHLGDIPATRAATLAISKLHRLLGDEESAVREARSLVSLCHSSPVASEAEYEAAREWLAQLGERAPRLPGAPGSRRGGRDAGREGGRENRRERPAPAQGEPKGAADGEARGARDEALALAELGDHAGALRALRGRRGASVDLLRTWIQLARALATADAGRREADLRDLEQRLRRRVRGEAADAEPRPEPARERAPVEADEAPETADDPLSKLLGRPAPRRRERRNELIERFAEEHPERVDELAAAALEHHVLTAGPRTPVPWLASVVGRALAADGPRTAATLERMGREGVFAVTAYQEEPFGRLVRLMRAAHAEGLATGALRRGVLARAEPQDRKLWTLRVGSGEGERMLVIAPTAAEPYPEGMAARLAQRLTHLCPRLVLLAPGPGNAGLREAAGALGLRVLGADPGDEELLAALADAPVVEAALEPRESAEPGAEERRAPESGPRPAEQLADALSRDASIEELAPLLERFGRRFRAVQAAERALGPRPDDDRVANLLAALHAVAPEGEALPEAVTLAVRAAASGGARSRAALVEEPLAHRFGGPGIDVVIDLARVALDEGWELYRVLRGPTRREREAHPVLETLGPPLQGVWRLLLRRGEARGEIWYVAHLPIEGRAALPQMLLEEGRRVVVLPIDADLLAWYGTLRAPEAIGWTGSETEALRTELASWTAPGLPNAEAEASLG